jgi:hypothetical protein
MNAPTISAREDYLGAIDHLIALEESNAKRLENLEQKIGARDSYTIDDLCKLYHCKRDRLTRAPWRLPNYGRSDFGASPKRWWRPTVEAWEAVSEEEHRADWERMSADKKREALGVSA